MAKNLQSQSWLLPVVAVGSLALGAFLSAKFDLDDMFEGKKKGRHKKWRGKDDVYLVTDEDYSQLNIAKKPLNMGEKIKSAKQKKVLYGDASEIPSMNFAGFSNTVSPYGQGASAEFTRLPGSEGFSRSNTRGNTLNLY